VTDGKKLTARQQRFVEEFVKDANATQAAVRAGFSKKSARRQGTRLSTDVHIRAAVDALRIPVVAAIGITLEGHLAELAALREEAKRLGQVSAAVAAEVARGKVSGLGAIRYTPEELAAMPDEQFEQVARKAKLLKPGMRLLA
jgi:hypothetical protein